ncbi:MAG: hypothetical protein AB7P03_23185 [Kofleriaceae bacterium]
MSALAGCLDPALAPCGALVCPIGTTCVAGELCASPDRIAACTGIGQGETCSVGTQVGRCDRGVCVATGCGNSIKDLGEECDDGNTTSGDGCRGDCGKVEVCGDAILDDGEGCDDGNANGADGCDACTPTTWHATTMIGGTTVATESGLAYPVGIAADWRGNFYIADVDNHRVRRVDVNGVITTVAGTGAPGSDGDGGLATGAQLHGPSSVAVDGLGRIFIADTNNHRIRRVDTTGVISTVAGTGTPGFSGDNGAATSAELSGPFGVAVDGLGNLYIADTANQRIRRVDVDGTITTVAGTGVSGAGGAGGPATSAELAFPLGVAVAAQGTLYIADTSNHRVARVDDSENLVIVAGTGSFGATGDGGPATSATLYQPFGVAVDPAGNVYIDDRNNHRIRWVDSAGTIRTVAGIGTGGFNGDGGAATSAQLLFPTGVAIDGMGNLYVADADNRRIRRIDMSGVITTVAGTGAFGFVGDGGAATSAQLLFPAGIAVDGQGALYITEENSQRIRRVDEGGVVTTIAGTGSSGASGDGGPAATARLSNPFGLARDSAGNLYVGDTLNHRVRRIDSNGIITTVAGTGTPGYSGDLGPAISAQLAYPHGVAIDAVGNLYVADTLNHRVRKIATNGVITTVAGSGAPGSAGDQGPAIAAQLVSPYGVAADGSGNLYICDRDAHRIRRVDPDGVIATIAGTGTSGFGGDNGPATAAELALPTGVATGAGGILYIADRGNHRIRRIDAGGTITTLVGTGTPGQDGDAGAATTAQLFAPTAMAQDGAGNLYIADRENHRIRRLDASGVITTVAGRVDPEGMGPLAQARLADPRAIAFTGSMTFVAGGSSGTVQAARATPPWLEVVAGRYPSSAAMGMLARFRSQTFGEVRGIAYDAASGLIYLSETSSNRLHAVTIVDPDDASTWTIAPLANTAGTAGFEDGPAAAARFRAPTGLYFDPTERQLYVADTGNHVIRAIDLSSGIAGAMVRTLAGTPATLGFLGDGGAATAALLFSPQALTRCSNGDLFIADTGNHRVRRVAAATGLISTVLGVGVPASSGEGFPAFRFPVDAPLGLACDGIGNLFVSSTTTVRLVPADPAGVVDGTGPVQTIYGAPPRDSFPASVTTCLTGLLVIDATTIQVVDACTGLLVELRRAAL